jgi:hypothetical protein
MERLEDQGEVLVQLLTQRRRVGVGHQTKDMQEEILLIQIIGLRGAAAVAQGKWEQMPMVRTLEMAATV